MLRLLDPGPVFLADGRAAARRWQTYAVRAGLGLLLLAALGYWAARAGGRSGDLAEQRQALAEVSQAFFRSAVGVQLAVVILAATVSAAGSVCLDRERGTLTLVFTTDLSAREIVLGKALSRLVPAAGLALMSLPVALWCTLLGGVEPEMVLGACAVTLGAAALSVGVGVLLSVWCGRVRTAATAALGLWAAALAWPAWEMLLPGLRGGAGNLLAYVNPFAVAFAREALGLSPADALAAQLKYAAVALGVGGLALVPAVLRLRARGGDGRQSKSVLGVVLRAVAAGAAAAGVGWLSLRVLHPGLQTDRSVTGDLAAMVTLVFSVAVALRELTRLDPAAGSGWSPEPPPDAHPVLWRERHRRLSAAERWAQTVFLAAALPVVAALLASPGGYHGRVFVLGGCRLNVLLLGVSFLVLAVRSAAALSEERRSTDAAGLAATPLSTAGIFGAKWLGVYFGALRLVAVPAVVMLALAVREWRLSSAVLMLAYLAALGAVWTSTGLLAATLFRRVGVAVTVNVLLYVGSTLGFSLAGYYFRLSPDLGSVGNSLVLAFAGVSPVVGWLELAQFGLLTDLPSPQLRQFIGSAAVLTVTATALAGLALLGFGRVLGRERVARRRVPA